jgi:hypothetical protein
VEWKQLDEKHTGEFDIALIDINLGAYSTPNDEKPEGIKSPDFDRKAGFYIYHQLIKRGFPDDNIAFFTGEKQSLREFSSYCGDIFLDKPAHCFQKSSNHFKELRRWLAQKISQPSLILRRGVIDGCRFVAERMETVDASDLESSLLVYKTTGNNVSADPEVFRKEILDYVRKLAVFYLPFRVHNEASAFLFVRELAAKWEGSTGGLFRTKQIPRFETKFAERFFNTSQLQMKLLRNWSEHGLLSGELTEKELAYFFIIAMRSLVASDLGQVFAYERLLGTLFVESPDSETQRPLKAQLEYYLEKSYRRLNTLNLEIKKRVDEIQACSVPELRQKRRPHDNHFLERFRSLGDLVDIIKKDEALRSRYYEFYRRRVRGESLRLFYESFWHGLYPLYLGKPLYANLQSVGFNLQPIAESFLAFLGQMILGECFKETDLETKVA